MTKSIDAFATATGMRAALRAREISAVELAELHIDRIEQFNERINAIVVRTDERALEAARRADQALARGRLAHAPLLGLPMTIKESTQAAGLPQSAGLKDLADYRPDTDGLLVQRIAAAGAGLLGKTNIPIALADWQADSPVYGRTNNPWDLGRTPGGSTGGGGAALAAGLTPLEIGSDIGGSIRVPAAYCGVYGHRPSETAIPREGSFPRGDLPSNAAMMGVQGPLARSAHDLELLFDVLAGPVAGEQTAWRLALPPSRHTRLADFRVAVMPELPWARPSSAMQQRVDELATFLGRAGARVATAMPDVDADAYFADYGRMLMVQTASARPRADREQLAARMRAQDEPLAAAEAEGLTLDAAGFLALAYRREIARAAWRRFFEKWDLLLAPMTLDAAFPHQTAPFPQRRLDIDGVSVPYSYNLIYPMWTIFAGQPSTAFPAGRNADGLPLGLQVIGPYLEDRTPLRFAQLLEEAWYRFEPPPGY
jgi:amidase